MSNDNVILYATTKDFSTSTMKQARSNYRRMLRKYTNASKETINVIEFSFSDSDLETANRLYVRIELNSEITEDNTSDTKEFLLKRCEKIQYKTSDMKRFTQVDTIYDLYSKTKSYFNLKQR